MMGYLEQSRRVLLIRLEAMLTGPGNHRHFDANVDKYAPIAKTISDYLACTALQPGQEWADETLSHLSHIGSTRVYRTPNGRTALMYRFDYPNQFVAQPQWIFLGSMAWSKAYETSPASDSQGAR